MPTIALKWKNTINMTEQEKIDHLDCETTGGYLYEFIPKITRQEWWNNLSDNNKNEILSLPNFDADIFKQITGIDVNAD